ncbi:hypothetical protein [Methylobacterium sp. A54F]
MRIAILLFGLVSFASIAAASGLPPLVEAEIAELKQDCSGGKVTLEPGFLTRKDVNGDGIEDIILDYAAVRCGDSGSLYCGSAGCIAQVFASRGGGYVKVLNDNVRDLKFARVKGRPAMLLGLHGTACGKLGSAPCGVTLVWNGSKFTRSN